MDYDKLSIEELFEQFKKQYYNVSEIASENLNISNPERIHTDLMNIMNDMELDDYRYKNLLTTQQTEQLGEFIEVANKLDEQLLPTLNGTTFSENFILEHNQFGYNKTGITEWQEYSLKVPDDISNINEDIDEADRLAREAEEEITEDLADGDAMTEELLDEGDSLDLTDEERAALVDDIEQINDANDPRRLGGLDPDVDIPDTIPDDLVDEVDRDRLREFLELAEPEGTVEFTAEEIAEQADLNAQSQLTPNESNTFADIVDNLNNQADNLPVDKAIKQRFKNKVTSLTTRLLTPGGLIDYVDIYETAVLGLGMVIAAAPELKNFVNTYAHNYWNNLAASHGVAAYNQKEYEPNWERINDVMNVVEKISPTDMLINKVMDSKTDTEYVSTYLPTGIDNTNVNEKLKGTLSFMRENPVNTDNESDKLKEAFINSNNKGNLMDERITLEGKLIPFNQDVYNKLDKKDKILYMKSRDDRLKNLGREKIEKDF
tara:strand:- start:3007 stop:4476 length:1470 start_codon:yes stop_codon:yes gene_type:complete